MFNRLNEEQNNLRTIKTARDLESINQGVKDGFFPLVKRVEKSELIKAKYAIFQHQETGEVRVSSDFRNNLCPRNDGFVMVIDYTHYYPYDFPAPYAAYLIPKDIKSGERVVIEDLVEDYVGVSWNQGDTYRLESCEAIWNGKDFDIQYTPNLQSDIIG